MESGGGIDPRVEMISQKLLQLQQMQVEMSKSPGEDPHGHGHSHGNGQECDGHHGMGGLGNPMMAHILQRMQTFIETQAMENTGSSENQAKVAHALQMIQRLQANIGSNLLPEMGLAIPMGNNSHGHGRSHTGLEGLPIRHGLREDVEALSEEELEKRKLALMAGDIASNAPHNQQNWVKYPKGCSDGPVDSFLHGGGHYTPPVYGWGELVREVEPSVDAVKKPKPRAVQAPGSVSYLMPHETEGTGSVIYKNLPIIGRVRFLTDLTGIFFWTVVVLYWTLGNYSTWFCLLLPHYADGNISVIWLIIYGIISALCITSHFRASTMNPGKIPYYVSQDSIDHPDWSYCHQCDCKRPPRAHHCRRCKQCVLKMDHHCPWINNCVGEENQWAFILLITYAQLTSLFSLAFDILWYFEYLPPCRSCDPNSFAIFHQDFFVITVGVMAILMIIFSAGLLCSQHMSLLLDYTQLEWMQLEKQVAASGKMPDPKDMPRMKGNLCVVYKQLCGQVLCILWPFPCRRRIAPVLKRMEDV